MEVTLLNARVTDICAQTHTTTHCNTLQHTATLLCNTLQHTTTHCNTVQCTLSYTATHCNTLCNTLHYIATHTAKRNETYTVNRNGSDPAEYASDRHTRTGTHCNTLQHTLQHNATHSATHTATHTATRYVHYEPGWR